METEDFVADFFDNIKKLKYHSFVRDEQSKSLRNDKENLQEGEIILGNRKEQAVLLIISVSGGDFAENYSHVVQDAAQSYHWNTDQTTLHPW
jgi:hypothetical protein